MNYLLKSSLCVMLIILATGCVTRTEFGRRRLIKISDYPTVVDSRVYKIVDTTKLYEIVSVKDTNDNKPLHSMQKSYLKFYNNGRVGTFYSYQPAQPETLNPKKAEIGYYSFDGKNLKMRTFFEHPQGGGWIRGQLITKQQDKLFVNSGNLLAEYKPLAIPSAALIYKADW